MFATKAHTSAPPVPVSAMWVLLHMPAHTCIYVYKYLILFFVQDNIASCPVSGTVYALKYVKMNF